MNDYDVIVIGAGHAGIEAAMAASRMGQSTLLVTLNKDNIGLMSCNPAIGGVGKAQLVREIDALGGQMAIAADACGMQFRMLNASKGAAVQSLRAQIDMYRYNEYMKDLLHSQKGLDILEAEVESLLVKDGQVRGVLCAGKKEIYSGCVVLCPGTFLNGIIHVGLNQKSGGRFGERSSKLLNEGLKNIGLNLLRFKTGTCPRLDRDTIDFSSLIKQEGDAPPQPFSFSTKSIKGRQTPCYITYTNEETHSLIMNNLDRSPLYSGVRYCPSIEDKVVKFPERYRHQIFLEPQGASSKEIYPNGVSTSLPEDVQIKALRTIAGLEKVEVIRFGYGIEHSIVEPTQLYPGLEAKAVKNLFLAGQINGTTGYEEAAAQGLIAGINAARRMQNKEALVMDRSSGYIGVLIDDLVTKGTNEPYRMFTSRVEYRLLLRQDNADLRLSKFGFDLGLVSSRDFHLVEEKARAIEEAKKILRTRRLMPTGQVNQHLASLGSAPLRKPTSLEDMLKRPQVSLEDLKAMDHLELEQNVLQQVEIEVKYAGFIQRQIKDVQRFVHLEKIRLSKDFDYSSLGSLSREVREKLEKFRPLNLGQASRISGITPAAISVLMVHLKKING
jgi:tRNA uridine 5-carboxymethylaminomethyl modification enzyme